MSLEGQIALKFFSVGDIIRILRTDGRVHKAVVSKLILEKQSIKTEWYEDGEIKGKELDAILLYHWNPEKLEADFKPKQRQIFGWSYLYY